MLIWIDMFVVTLDLSSWFFGNALPWGYIQYTCIFCCFNYTFACCFSSLQFYHSEWESRYRHSSLEIVLLFIQSGMWREAHSRWSIFAFKRSLKVKMTFLCWYNLFRGEITPLSSSYNIPGLVPVCWLLFQCFWLKPVNLKKVDYFAAVRGLF